jgi:hypothetical protein
VLKFTDDRAAVPARVYVPARPRPCGQGAIPAKQTHNNQLDKITDGKKESHKHKAIFF